MHNGASCAYGAGQLVGILRPCPSDTGKALGKETLQSMRVGNEIIAAMRSGIIGNGNV